MTEPVYQVFGSEDSIDCDIMVFADSIGTVAESRTQVDLLKQHLQPECIKQANVNLAVVKDGIVVEVFKGTADEVNNSLLATYYLHEQRHPQRITRSLPRDAGLKNLRAMRAILSFASRTQYRVPIKKALVGTSTEKYSLLEAIRFDCIADLGHKNTSLIDFYKTLAFQMGQSYLLNKGIEAYTKSDIAKHLPELSEFLARRPAHPITLDGFKSKWLQSFSPDNMPIYEELRR